MEREAERKRLQATIRMLGHLREEGKLELPSGRIHGILNEMRDIVATKSVEGQRTLLAKVAVGMTMGPARAYLVLTFPLSAVIGKYRVPQGTFNAAVVANLRRHYPDRFPV